MATIEEMKIELGPIELRGGSHSVRTAGTCAMEAAALVSGRPHSDHDDTICPVIGVFFREWNDALANNGERGRLLKPLIPLIVGTRSTQEVASQRAWMATDWMLREHLPIFMKLDSNLARYAENLQRLPEVTPSSMKAIEPTARAAWAAAGSYAARGGLDAAGDAGWHAARAASMLATNGWDIAGDISWLIDATVDRGMSQPTRPPETSAQVTRREALRALAQGKVVRIGALDDALSSAQLSAQGLVRRMCVVGSKR